MFYLLALIGGVVSLYDVSSDSSDPLLHKHKCLQDSNSARVEISQDVE